MSVYAAPPWKKQGEDSTHTLISVNIPADGYLVFTCSSKPKVPMTAFERVARCPLCKGQNPLKEGK